VTVVREGEAYSVRYKAATFKVNSAHYLKLQRLYARCEDPRGPTLHRIRKVYSWLLAPDHLCSSTGMAARVARGGSTSTCSASSPATAPWPGARHAGGAFRGCVAAGGGVPDLREGLMVGMWGAGSQQ
jgi:hypothetical protein